MVKGEEKNYGLYLCGFIVRSKLSFVEAHSLLTGDDGDERTFILSGRTFRRTTMVGVDGKWKPFTVMIITKKAVRQPGTIIFK